MTDPSPEDIARKLPRGARYLMWHAKPCGYVDADVGNGHSVNALRRRALVYGDPIWWPCVRPFWGVRLTSLGELVSAMVREGPKPTG